MNARDFVNGYATGFNDGLKYGGGGSEGGDEWTFPEHWPDIPEPAPNQVIMYVEAAAGDVAPIIGLYGNNYDGGTINYGDDGYTYEYPAGYGYNVYHVYQVAGQYIITITAPGGEVYLNAGSTNVRFMDGLISEGSFGGYSNSKCLCIRAIKVGRNIRLGTGSTPITDFFYGEALVYIEFMGGVQSGAIFSNHHSLKKIKIGTPPETFGQGAFHDCWALETADCTANLTSLDYTFVDCHSLKSVDISQVTAFKSAEFNQCYSLKNIIAPNLTTLGSGIFQNCSNLEEFYAPNLAEIGASDFYCCYSLRKLTLAENCNYNGNTFNYCPQLYPKPQ